MKDEIRKTLFGFRDEKYRDFQAKLMPGIDKERIIGVRTPILRKLAKEYSKNNGIESFLSDIPHEYYDEYNLHGFIVSECKDYGKTVGYVNELLPYIDNWATCDLLSPKCFKKHRTELKNEIEKWLASDREFTVRFGIEMAMSHFLDEDFDAGYLEKISMITRDEYYVKMMVAWYFATALTKQWDDTVKYIENKRLGVWEHNKTIQKANESYRISDERKEYLKKMKI